MASYFVMRLEKGKLNYNVVIEKYPQFKNDIDLILSTDGYEIMENGFVKKEYK